MKRRIGVWLFSLLLGAAVAFGQVQVPAEIKDQVQSFTETFATTLDQECEPGMCFAAGCKVGRFLTLDESQTSSLPGLDEPPPPGKPQYRLASVICEFSHEDKLDETIVSRLRQRLSQKVASAGVQVQVRARRLAPKADPVEDDSRGSTLDLAMLPPAQAFWLTILPFLPWLVTFLTFIVAILALVWGFRTLGRPKPVVVNGEGVGGALITQALPTPNMLISRIRQLKDSFAEDTKLVEQTLRAHFEEHNFDELCLYLRTFGPDFLDPLKGKAEYKEALSDLSSVYNQKNFKDDPLDTWEFLGRVEKSLTAAKIRIDQQPVEDEFGFLVAISPDELVGLLRELTEDEAVATIAYAPRGLREAFFAQANPRFTAKFIEQLTQVDRLPDAFVRETARKLRRFVEENGTMYKVSRVDRMPLLEQALNSLDSDQRKELFLDLGKDNPQLMAQIAPAIFLDDSLPHLSAEMITEAFLAVSPKEAAAYLDHYSWGEELLNRMNPRLKSNIENQTVAAAQSAHLIQGARRKISEFVREKDRQGIINLRQINAKVIGETKTGS